MTQFRRIPSIEQLLQRPRLQRAAAEHGREAITSAARDAAAEMRERFAESNDAPPGDAAGWIEARALELARARQSPSLRRVINATGVILHTNLGRAPLAENVAAHAARLAAGYTNLEYDLEAGTRASRHAHAAHLLRELTGAEAALVANNAAAAALLTLASLAAGREVIVSRGELVEIGGGFRVPEILAQSGAKLREVGTTNRTRVADYAAAVSEQTALILRVHPSNFHIEGFAERPALADLIAIARRFSLPLVEDLGSGWLGVGETPPGLRDEPSVRASLTAGADLVIFSGDKLLGGPQAGLLVGSRALIQRIGAHPLMRAVRADKLTYAALEATLAMWSADPSRGELPIVQMLTATAEAIRRRAQTVASRVPADGPLSVSVISGASTVGGGSAPSSQLATALLAIRLAGVSADDLARRLRRFEPPIIARIQDDAVVLDLRTVSPSDDATVADGLTALTSSD